MARHRPLRFLLRLLGLTLALIVAYVLGTGYQVWTTAGRDEREPAEAIVVLGAAQYDGRPSPVFQGRLDHALELWEQQVAPIIAVTGGSRPGDSWTEASAAAAYLRQRGVPDDRIWREVHARNTWESLAATSRILKDAGLHRVVLVSDPTHALRIKTIAEDLGLDAQVSPTRRTPPTTPLTSFRQGLRETVAVAAGRIIGHRRLTVLEQIVVSRLA
jgi:uncharacterized SAM-binding protein YcdF (DUF218 family)